MQNVGKAGSVKTTELGRINSNGTLYPDESPGPIPREEYSVCGSEKGRINGKRVMINWCGAEPVVVDVID
jgi:hypothetical protein